jgi:glycosyltransferase involved in cell wall biosynthesis
MRLAVDAWNLVDDHRGMGRYVRRVLTDWQTEASLDLTLIAKTPAHAATLAHEFPYAVRTGTRERYDAVWYPWNAMRFAMRGARSLVLFHDTFAFTYPHKQWIARRREQTPIRRAIAKADARSANSYWSAQELARVFALDASSFAVVHPVPDPWWEPVDSSERGAYVLVVAGPEERKNLSTLVHAFERAFPQRNCELVVVGAVSARDEALLVDAMVAHARVHPDDAELRMLYSGALAVAVPSSAEGYGLMAVEAMACGAPVVASDAAALPEACDGAAMLVPPFDTDGWARALRTIAGDRSLRASMRERSLARAARIDRSEPARRTLALLEELLGKRP